MVEGVKMGNKDNDSAIQAGIEQYDKYKAVLQQMLNMTTEEHNELHNHISSLMSGDLWHRNEMVTLISSFFLVFKKVI